MTITDPNIAEGTATVFTWLADKVLGGAKRALGWGWERTQWAAAQDRYDEQIIKQYGWIRIFGQTTPKPLKEVLTDVYMLDKPTAFRRFDPDALRRHLWEEDRGLPFRFGERLPADELLGRGSKFFLLGKPGAGKTTFLKHLAVREAQRGKWGPCLGKVPIFIPLKQFAESGRSLFDFIVEQFAVCHFPEAAPFVEPLLKAGKALVLFDGLDEVSRDAEAHARQRDQVTETIEQFSRQYDGCHIVITCRIAATEYTFDPAFVYLELADFAPDQVEAFVRNWFWDAGEPEQSAHRTDQMLTEWSKAEHAGIRDLTRNPLLLTLLCLNYAETLSFPVRRVEIYQEALDALLKKWDSSRQIRRSSLYGTLSLGRKQQMFSRIAYDGLLLDEILFPQADLEARLKAYLVHVSEVPHAIDIDAETVLAEIVEQHGIFAEQAHGLFSFAHLTFQEYYVARYLVENPTSDTFEPLMVHVTNDKWRDVFLLTASLLPDATVFLTEFDTVLHRLISVRPRLVAWLQWLVEQAMASLPTYGWTTTRVYYARVLDLNLARAVDFELDFARDVALLLHRDLDLDLDRFLAGGFDRALDSDVVVDRGLLRYLLCVLNHPYARVAVAARARALALARDLNLALARDLDLDLARDRAKDLARARGVDPASIADPATDLAQLIEHIQVYCLQLRETDLNAALSALVVPLPGAPQTQWADFAAHLNKAIETRSVLARFDQLQVQVKTLEKEVEGRFDLDSEDLDVFVAYLKASQLFYDCLQLAYTPYRREFEDRMFLPPPLPEQKA